MLKINQMNRRHLLGIMVAVVATESKAVQAAQWPAIMAYRNPGCGCCEVWVEHMRKAGFEITMEDDADLEGRRTALGVPADLAGCHTAMIGDKIIEGHVPVEDVIRFLNEGGKGAGLAVPGMPMGSPGMEMGNSRDAFDVVLFQTDGTRSVFKTYNAV